MGVMNLKKDHFLYGVLLGVLVPVIIYSLLFLLGKIVDIQIRNSTKELVSIFAALPLFRYFIVKLGADKTGRGILLVIFIYAMFFCVREFNLF